MCVWKWKSCSQIYLLPWALAVIVCMHGEKLDACLFRFVWMWLCVWTSFDVFICLWNSVWYVCDWISWWYFCWLVVRTRNEFACLKKKFIFYSFCYCFKCSLYMNIFYCKNSSRKYLHFLYIFLQSFVQKNIRKKFLYRFYLFVCTVLCVLVSVLYHERSPVVLGLFVIKCFVLLAENLWWRVFCWI